MAPLTVAADSAVQAFDAAKSLERFLADELQTTLELPSSLSAEQRKQVKKLVEQHPNGALRCESYGFGADRQMHIFKVTEKSPADSAGSTAAFNSSSNSSSNSPREGQPTKKELQVRNTFIHFEESSKAKGDERVVQSMPDGVFRQHLLAEAAERAAASGCGVVQGEAEKQLPAADEGSDLQDVLSPGMQVCVHGLVRAPAFNGRSGIVQAPFDREAGRYSVLLSLENGTTQLAKIKADNLRRMADASERPRPQGLDFESPASPASGYHGNVFPGTPLWEDRAPTAAPLRLTALV